MFYIDFSTTMREFTVQGEDSCKIWFSLINATMWNSEDREINPMWMKTEDSQARPHLIYPTLLHLADLICCILCSSLCIPLLVTRWLQKSKKCILSTASQAGRNEGEEPSSYNSQERKSFPEAPNGLSHISYRPDWVTCPPPDQWAGSLLFAPRSTFCSSTSYIDLLLFFHVSSFHLWTIYSHKSVSPGWFRI